MKYVDCWDLDELSSQLCFSTPEAHVRGGVDLYTTKPATSDRKLMKELDRALDGRAVDEAVAIDDDIDFAGSLTAGSFPGEGFTMLSPPSSFDRKKRANSASALPFSPFGPLNQVASRKQYAYLISVLNANDPDRDFSALAPELFQREMSAQRIAHSFGQFLLALGSNTPTGLWDAIDRYIDVRDCRMYSLSMPEHFLQDEPGALWARMWFYFNKRRKRVLFLHMKGTSPRSPELKPETNVPVDDYDLVESFQETVLGDLE